MKLTKQQKELYRELIKRAKENKYTDGICIVLGRIQYGSWFGCPWSCWSQLLKYHPIFKKYPKPTNGLFGSFSERKRKRVILSLEARLNKKKDPYFGKTA